MVQTISPVFIKVFAILIGEEGGFTNDPADPGNWTGGAVNAGVCKGTKFGISASAYPGTDIANLTLDQARTIYSVAYWAPIEGEYVPPAIGLLLFDAAVNNGVERSVRFLQAALGVAVDGVMGPQTRDARDAAVHADAKALAVELLARRIDFMGGLAEWLSFGLGWSRRLAALPFKATDLGGFA